MRRLNRNYWRLGWVLLTNGAVILALLTAPILVYHNQLLISRSLRFNPPPFSYWTEFLAVPWGLVLLPMLLAGIVAEVRRSVLGPIINLTTFSAWLFLALWERTKISGEATPQELFLGKVLLIFPLIAVIGIDLIFYIAAFRGRQVKDAASNLPSQV